MQIDSTKPPPNAAAAAGRSWQTKRQLTDVPIVHTLYETYRCWHELLLKFPKSQRYMLGHTCTKYLLDILECTLAAAGIADHARKLERLRTVSAKLDTLRLLIRLCKDTRCIANAAYLDIESKLHDVGRMLGGWMKSLA